MGLACQGWPWTRCAVRTDARIFGTHMPHTMPARTPLAALLLLASLHPASAQSPVELQLVPWASGLSQVVDLAHAGDGRLFAVRRPGVISIISDSMTVDPQAFLNITSAVNDQGSEQGMLSMVFDPDYANNGFFYVYYIAGTGNGTSRISRFSVSSDPDVADPGSEQVIYQWPQPNPFHNGGDLAFGPDGMLYIALGDGAAGGDPYNNAQDLTDPLGDILRIDVSDPNTTWTVPPDNPWAALSNDTLPEIWASGLRNPFRMGFDRVTGDLWVGDVGQNAWEEIDFWPAGDNSGPNFGWRCYEGDSPYNMQGCQGMSNYEFPVSVHENVATGGTWCSAIGGRVYRGSSYPRLAGRYIYTDYCAGEFWMLRPDGQGGWLDELGLATGAFGYVVVAEDAAGELYTANASTGQVRKIVDRCPMAAPTITFDGTTFTSTPANSYQWYLDGAAIPGAQAQSFVPSASGLYYVVAGFANSCSFASDTLEFLTIGMQEPGAGGVPRVFPQPAANELQVEWKADAADRGWRILDPLGRELLRGTWPAGRERVRFDVSGLPPGMLMLQVVDQEGRISAARPVVVR